jgi:electron transport complex protein RnfB
MQSILADQKKSLLLAFIREAECIGCTKCIQACPFDAIIGAEKQLHTVLTDECIGCNLCIEPCPVDCIEMQEVAEQHYQLEKVKQRVLARKKRLAKQINEQTKIATELATRQAYIQAAVARVKIKRAI